MVKTVRARQFMYVQDLKHLKIKVNELKDILQKSGCSEWAYILHDQDETRPHLHVVLKYDNPQVLNNIVKLFNDQPQYLEVWHGRINNAYSYLLHRTKEAQNKYQYDPQAVTASFDFVKRMESVKTEITQKDLNSSNVVNTFINQYAEDVITFEQLEKQIGIAELAKKKNVLDHIDELKARKKHQEWLKKFQGKRAENIWLWGESGVGKTSYAKHLAGDHDVAILGSSRDYFQEYHGETIVILNDLRPDDFQYGDLLRILDPYEHDKYGPRRYHDVPLNIELLLITSPYSPWEFYKASRIDNKEIDTYTQLKRRIHAIQITKEYIKEVMPNGPANKDHDEWEGIV